MVMGEKNASRNHREFLIAKITASPTTVEADTGHPRKTSHCKDPSHIQGEHAAPGSEDGAEGSPLAGFRVRQPEETSGPGQRRGGTEKGLRGPALPHERGFRPRG